MKLWRSTIRVLCAFAIFCSVAVEAESPSSQWITLGTVAGPIPNPQRSQPANALVTEHGVYLVDAGDGAAERLAAAKIPLAAIRAVFISHLHFDHTGGLPAILGLRWQTNAPDPIVIYGPPGTKDMVEGIFAYMAPGAAGGYGIPGSNSPPADHNVEVVEIHDGSTVELDAFSLNAVRNTHYSWPEGSSEWEKYQSLSFRFSLPDRAIVYTGDTGPSPAVETLAKDADLLVTEMMDLDGTVAIVKRNNPNMPEGQFKGLIKHLSTHHLSPEQVGDLASHAKVKKVVVTHLGPGTVEPLRLESYRERIADRYDGEAVIASDLDRF